MSISFSGSTLTFSDSTTMTTAATAGPPGPTGPTGTAGPTGPAGSNATVSTTYGAVGTPVIAAFLSGCCTSVLAAGSTVSGACLVRAATSVFSVGACYHGGAMNTSVNTGYPPAFIGRINTASSSNYTSLGLSGTWRSMTYSKSNSYLSALYNLYVRVS